MSQKELKISNEKLKTCKVRIEYKRRVKEKCVKKNLSFD